jgi:hypothetical protein
VTLVRVYCGLASAESSAPAPEAQNWLTVSIVDDAGRLLDICEITDDPGGYAELCALFAQRGDGPASVAVATASNDHAVTQLLTAAGRYIAYAGAGTADDFAERFADDDSPDEIRSGPAERRAIGLARALQAGVLSAIPQATPPEMISVKPLLTAHAAIVSGRQQAAGTLREVLRELYPAALRAYADPAEPVSLAVLQALPEPGQLVSGAAGRSREGQVIATLVDAGVAEKEILDEAVTALRVAVAETPRRAGVTRAMTSAVAETVRQAVASVRCFDAASEALVAVIADRMTPPIRQADTPVPEPMRPYEPATGRATPLRVVAGALDAPGGALSTATGAHSALSGSTSGHRALGAPTGGHGVLSAPTGGHGFVKPGEPAGPLPPAAARGTAQAPAASLPPAGMVAVPAARPGSSFGGTEPTEPQPSTDLPSRIAPGGRTAIPPTTRQSRPAYGSDPAASFAGRPAFGSDADSFVGLPAFGTDPTTTFGGQPAPNGPSGAAAAQPGVFGGAGQRTNGQPGAPFGSGSYQTLPPPPPPPARSESENRNSRSTWPLAHDPEDSGPHPLIAGSGAADIPQPVGPGRTEPGRVEPSRVEPSRVEPSRVELPRRADPRIPEQARPVEPATESLGIDLPRQREGRVKPPWQDDLPAEPPTLRLVEPAPLADPALSPGRTDDLGDLRFDPPTLRLVPSEPAEQAARPGRRPGDEPLDGPVDSGSDDSDLLIFAACRSAWFTDPSESDELDWSNAADFGWEAASQAARPAVGAETVAGLPRRVPQQNLVPGSATVQPEEVDRPLRIIRDAAAIAAHTSGYFSGYRRGQEVGGYPVGGRPGRESSVGWDFSRDASGDEEYLPINDYEYRSARR